MSLDHYEILEKSPLGVVVCDENQRITWCNDRFLKETQIPGNEVIGRLFQALPIDCIDNNAEQKQLFSSNGKDNIRFQYWQETLEKSARGSVHYFTKERGVSDKVSQLMAKVTGAKLPQRASWVEFLNYEVSRSRRYDNPLSILKLHLLVLDKPDNVNQKTIHQTIRDTLMDELRWADMIGHTDHDTYLMVLPETPGNSLDALQLKLSSALDNQLQFISKDIKYQAIFGQAAWQKHDDSQQLLKRARLDLVEKLEALLTE